MLVPAPEGEEDTTRDTGHFCTCLQIYKLTCHWCLLGLFWGECGALLLFASRLLRGSPFEDFTPGCPRLGASVSPPPGWSCAVTTNGLDAVSHKHAQGLCTRPWWQNLATRGQYMF